MKRREFITLLGGAGAVWPIAARAQQPGMPVVGYLYLGTPEQSASLLAAFRKGLSETGYVEGRNVAIEYRWAQNDNSRLPELVADLIRRRVAVIATPQSAITALAAKAATTTIPIVFSAGVDPVQVGLVASLNRPGGNATGFNTMNNELGAKRLGLLHELVPKSARLAVLHANPADTNSLIADLQTAATALGRQFDVLSAASNSEIDKAFASFAQMKVDALMVMASSLFSNRRAQLVTLAARYAVPAIYSDRDITEAGGLMSYASNIPDLFRQVGIYVGRILKGEKPADLPVMRATKFEFVINLQTAKLLGLTIPPTLLAIADEVIE